MFYYLYELTHINFFSYITVRTGLAFFISFVLCAIFMKQFILLAKKKNVNQPIYERAPQQHKQKAKTPTMGGIIFIGITIIASLLSAKLDNNFVLTGLFVLFSFCLIGFIDDWLKIKRGKNQYGLSARSKLIFQSLLGVIIAILLYENSDFDTQFYLPFYKNSVIDLKYFALFFWILVIVAASNATNITDGLDGLVTVPAIASIFTLGVYAYLIGNAVYSSYLFLPKFNGLGELIIVAAAMIGALFGFLWYNCHPAEIFMGDSGSLALGAFIGYMGIVTKNEILLILIGFIFVLETISVILQVSSFKILNKRIFLMAPLHHHFEAKGWSETKIIVRFWMIALLTNLIALIAIKLR